MDVAGSGWRARVVLGQRSDGVYGVLGYHREERDVRGGYWRVVHSRGGARTWIGQTGWWSWTMS